MKTALPFSAFGYAALALAAGNGPYDASHSADPSLPNHTIYKPNNPGNITLPILIWGNGACSANGTLFGNLLTNIASYGFIAIASGSPNGRGTTDVQLMKDALDWIEENAGTGKYTTVDTSRVAVAGQSCGGLEAYQMRDDPRVQYLGIFNSGFLDLGPIGEIIGLPGENPETIKEIRRPVFYFLGGEDDIAYPNGMADYDALTGVPKWVGNYPVGHMGTYAEPEGGAFGVAAVNWLSWVLKEDTSQASWFTGGGAEEAGWEEIASEGLDGLLTFTHGA
ncbi:alpha/beta hydrolase family protein [Aspergillus undulatus]|uniref:alpha/beta hydrolase family protein n=1 Tax=Aspergillus undulatus TaxID=1810928 RepID=UPI003CCD2E5D